MCDEQDIAYIARGQVAAEEALARQANRLLICDTDPLLTCVWSEVLFDRCPAWLCEMAEKRHYDLYLLTDIDAPWVDDGQRYLQNAREEFMNRCRKLLDRLGRRYVTLSGSWDNRLKTATEAIYLRLKGAS